jgi:hypothetical protein
MYALVGRVEIKPGHEEETAMMAREHGPTLVGGMSGNNAAYWARAPRRQWQGDPALLLAVRGRGGCASGADRVQLATRDARSACRLHQRRRVRSHRPDVRAIAWDSVLE